MIVTKEYLNELTYEIIGCAIEVHKILGPGLLESIYEKCFCRELTLKGINYKTQSTIDLDYKGLPKGILINFNCINIFKQEQKTLVNDLYNLLHDK